mmetsp:Transcript_12584/g.37842  ORF Transcript_12584/g.37842 Transcript_12584/m.37842 type:complete len:145 (-) Transcript_12584:2988-3422(-)
MAAEQPADDHSEDGDEEEKGDEDMPIDAKRAQRNLAHSKMLEHFTEAQLERYEAFRRSKFDRRTMKRLQQTIVGQQVSVNMALVMCGISKVFVGELIETARQVAEEQGQQGPLQPHHIQDAFQQLDREGRIPHLQSNNSPLRTL